MFALPMTPPLRACAVRTGSFVGADPHRPPAISRVTALLDADRPARRVPSAAADRQDQVVGIAAGFVLGGSSYKNPLPGEFGDPGEGQVVERYRGPPGTRGFGRVVQEDRGGTSPETRVGELYVIQVLLVVFMSRTFARRNPNCLNMVGVPTYFAEPRCPERRTRDNLSPFPYLESRMADLHVAFCP
ncbi:MAG: hypothetical protein C0467_33210 [Planctomycetaceae bacterium]|nr:hypothetical protein [Planctomycetaceae bacterium]